jgi:hypothetical protein
LPSDAPIESRRVNYHGEIRMPLVGFGDELIKQPPDSWEMAKYFRDPNYGEVLRIDHGFAADGPHAVSAYAEEFQRRSTTP